MREFLFRAYQKNFKRMLPVDSIKYNNNEIRSITVDNRGLKGNYSVTPTYSIYSKDSLDFPLDSLILIQYIGLKDRNKVEIFEGDIVKIYKKNTETGEIDVYIGSVVFIEKALLFAVNTKSETISFDLMFNNAGFYSYKIEVIGNIHDNKDLLK